MAQQTPFPLSAATVPLQVITVPQTLAGQRLDQVLAHLLPHYSRARIQQWIRSGHATVDAKQWRPKDRLRGGEQVTLYVESAPAETPTWSPEPRPIDLVYEDEALFVVNKPAGWVVHPGAGNPSGTLVNALVHHFPELSGIPRAGIIHRLDKDTTGLLIVARSLSAHKQLVEQLQSRQVRREYRALVVGELIAGGLIEAPIGRHPVQRTRMAVRSSGRAALTHYRVQQRLRGHTLVHLRLETGRTHQIRVHMACVGHPVFGDPIYGGRLRIPRGAEPPVIDALRRFKRQALHAARIELRHPAHGQMLHFEAPLPADMRHLLACLGAEEAW
jgi:23S rRNA pseudouridine1911/1915/1917 synthase